MSMTTLPVFGKRVNVPRQNLSWDALVIRVSITEEQ